MKVFSQSVQSECCTLVVCGETSDFRKLARSQLMPYNKIIDIGCSYGVGTDIISQHCPDVVGIDISEECIVKMKLSRQPNAF